MSHSPLISTIVAGLVLAFAFGALAHRFKIAPIVGYLFAGVVIGPFTPGFVADVKIANELAEIGVILLMFGVGLQFSLEELLSVRAIAVPGVIAQIAGVTALGVALGWAFGWPVGAGLVFGLALSVASTVVVLRALQERRLIETERGKISVGWLIVEDLFMVLALVLLPPLTGVLKGMDAGASLSAFALPVAWTVGKIVAFFAVMFLVGKRVIPWILHYVAHTGSRELFRLAVFAIALGVAGIAAELFGISFALGAFLAGMILSESQLSQRAAAEALPLRDAFAVLFFVSVGMLFDPTILWRDPLAVIATLLVITVAKSGIAYGVVRLFRYPQQTALMIAATRAQIGEFSFILVGLGVTLALLPERGRDLVLAGAILSILLNPVAFLVVDRMVRREEKPAAKAALPAAPEPTAPLPPVPVETPSRAEIPMTELTGHVVVVGHGRVGSTITPSLLSKSMPFLVIENDPDLIAELRKHGQSVINGNAADPEVVRAANLTAARSLLVAIPDSFEGGQVVEQARAINPGLMIVARSHSEEETAHLMRHGATAVIMGEQEIAKAMLGTIAGETPAPTQVAPVEPAHAAHEPKPAPTDAALSAPPDPLAGKP